MISCQVEGAIAGLVKRIPSSCCLLVDDALDVLDDGNRFQFVVNLVWSRRQVILTVKPPLEKFVCEAVCSVGAGRAVKLVRCPGPRALFRQPR